MRRWPVVATLVLGLGLVAAPAIFQMFSRAPDGGTMINEFRPYMNTAKIDEFQGFMAEMDAAVAQVDAEVEPAVQEQLGLDAGEFDERFTLTTRLQDEWDTIFADMNDDMLVTVEDNIDNYAAVDALPPFAMFPWFFVVPGLIVAGLAVSALRAQRRGERAGRRLIAIAVVGAGVLLAPAIFQMFTRAPEGGRMISDFESLMTRERVQTIQGYFVVIAGGEGELRNAVLSELDGAEDDYPAVAAFNEDWPTINSEMAPMIGAMSDNVENYAAVKALPPFPLFPWFFVIPGAAILILALVALRDGADATEGSGSDDTARPNKETAP